MLHRWCKVFILVIALLQSRPAVAQRLLDPPLTGRPEGFSGIVGRYQISAEAFPTEVQVEQPIKLHIIITGQTPPNFSAVKYEPKRENLHLFPETWEKQFYTEEMIDEHQVNRAKKTWTFVYRLRPKHTHIKEIKDIKCVYYDPGAPGTQKYVTRYLEAIPIVVKPRPTDGGPEVPDVVVPISCYQRIALNENDIVSPSALSRMALAGFLVVPPVSCLLGAYWWKKKWPGEREQRRQRRSRAADQASAALRKEDVCIWQIMSRYLQDRFDFDLEEPTPAEVEDMLRRRGFAKELCAQGEALFQTCDAMRYGSSAASDVKGPIEDALCWIAALEADPCAR